VITPLPFINIYINIFINKIKFYFNNIKLFIYFILNMIILNPLLILQQTQKKHDAARRSVMLFPFC